MPVVVLVGVQLAGAANSSASIDASTSIRASGVGCVRVPAVAVPVGCQKGCQSGR